MHDLFANLETGFLALGCILFSLSAKMSNMNSVYFWEYTFPYCTQIGQIHSDSFNFKFKEKLVLLSDGLVGQRALF